MARWTGCLGSRKRDRGERPRFDGPTSGGDEPPLSVRPAPTATVATVATEWQPSEFPPDAGPTGPQQPSGLVIHARRAGDFAPVPQPNSAA